MKDPKILYLPALNLTLLNGQDVRVCYDSGSSYDIKNLILEICKGYPIQTCENCHFNFRIRSGIIVNNILSVCLGSGNYDIEIVNSNFSINKVTEV